MTDNTVTRSQTGANLVDLHIDVLAGQPSAPPPGVIDDAPADQRDEDRLIDAERDTAAPTSDEETERRELDADEGRSADPADSDPQDDPVDAVGEAIATRGLAARPGD